MSARASATGAQRTSSNSASWSSSGAADRAHQEEVDRLVEAGRAADEEVADRAQRRLDLDLDAGLLARLAQGGLLDRLARVGRSLRQRPQDRGAPMDEEDLDDAVDRAMDDAAGRGGASGPQDGHPGTGPLGAAGARHSEGERGAARGQRAARPTAGKRKRLVCERRARTVAHRRHRAARPVIDGRRCAPARAADGAPSDGRRRSRWWDGR